MAEMSIPDDLLVIVQGRLQTHKGYPRGSMASECGKSRRLVAEDEGFASKQVSGVERASVAVFASALSASMATNLWCTDDGASRAAGEFRWRWCLHTTETAFRPERDAFSLEADHQYGIDLSDHAAGYRQEAAPVLIRPNRQLESILRSRESANPPSYVQSCEERWNTEDFEEWLELIAGNIPDPK